MHVLRGLENSWLIDDTYNASPLATTAALRLLQAVEAPQRIAILGSMNELGATSEAAHAQIGALCDATKLDWVITIGKDAEAYLAPAAAAAGCQVRSFASPYEAGGFAHSVLQAGAVILAKGSQNGVFAEEALKVLLHDPAESEQLVRQSPAWLAIKKRQFETPEGKE
jgi:UDP-N-acetylmuramoyl-tripeptide--D-alanyl-D-alanine ligase